MGQRTAQQNGIAHIPIRSTEKHVLSSSRGKYVLFTRSINLVPLTISREITLTSHFLHFHPNFAICIYTDISSIGQSLLVHSFDELSSISQRRHREDISFRFGFSFLLAGACLGFFSTSFACHIGLTSLTLILRQILITITFHLGHLFLARMALKKFLKKSWQRIQSPFRRSRVTKTQVVIVNIADMPRKSDERD